MAKINYNEQGLNSYILPYLRNCTSNLSSAIQIGRMLVIPNEFKYKRYLNSLDEGLNADLNNIKNVVNIINDTTNEFKSIYDKTNIETTSIQNISISLRQSPIK